jgi:hypothetical protein
MKALLLLLIGGLALGGCSKSAPSRTFSPVHTNLLVYFTGEGGRAIGEPGLKDLKVVVPRWEWTFKEDDRAYSATLDYKGSEGGKDFYLVTLTAPPGAVEVPAPAEIAYDGRQIELWSDSKVRINIRPRPSGEPDGAANRSQPGSSETNRTSAAAGSGR